MTGAITGIKKQRLGQKVPLVAGVALLSLSLAGSAAAQLGSYPFIHAEVPMPPTPVAGDGMLHMFYELHLTNFGRNPVRLERVEVLDGNSETVLAAYEDSDLTSRLRRLGPRDETDPENIAGGRRAVIYVLLAFEDFSAVPAGLRHRVTLTPAEDPQDSAGDASTTLEVARVTVNRMQPIVITPPLRGEMWLAANGPSNTSGHRRALIAIDGRARIAQRFAIDWVQLYDQGGTWKDDQLVNANYRCYGAEALAAADGTVANVKDGIPENVPGADSRAVPITLETVGGNFVILDLGEGRFAFYAHLQPGGIRVKPGQTVQRGEVLGLVGNSGNSTEPHLHFHIADATSPLGAEGLPYLLESFQVLGMAEGMSKKEMKPRPEPRQKEIPMRNAIVRFPGQRSQ